MRDGEAATARRNRHRGAAGACCVCAPQLQPGGTALAALPPTRLTPQPPNPKPPPLSSGKEVKGYNLTVGGGMGRTHRDDETFPRLADPLG